MPGPSEIGIIIVIAIIVFFLFGAKKLPELARSLGKSSKEFKKGMQEGADDDEKPAKPTESSDETKD